MVDGENSMSSAVFLFPGQGSQFSGMARDLFDRYDAVRQMFDMASDACGRDMSALLFEGSEEELKETSNAQPAIVLASLAARAALEAEGICSVGAAGHSLGEYTALADAGVLRKMDALKAVSTRGKLMSAAGERMAAEKGKMGMAAVLGMGPAAVREAIEGVDNVWSANENSSKQVVLGGTLDAIDRVSDALKNAGAKRIVPLKLSCPFHTPLMEKTAQEMKDFLGTLEFRDPVKTVWSNVTAQPVGKGEEARELLVKQITYPVRWLDQMESVAETKPPALCESGPGTVLTGLWNKSGFEGQCFPAGSCGNIDKITK